MKNIKTTETEYRGRRVFNVNVSDAKLKDVEYTMQEFLIKINPKKRRERNLKMHMVNIAQ